jgi:hypothetical protein
MKRFLVAVLLSTLLASVVSGCKKAHQAGNDSMSLRGPAPEAALFFNNGTGRSQESSATFSQSSGGQFHRHRLFRSFPLEGLTRTAVHQSGNVVQLHLRYA